MPVELDPPLQLAASDDVLYRGDLRARPAGKTLFISGEAYEKFFDLNVRTAADLITYINAYPSGVAAVLRWTDSDVATAKEKLAAALNGKVDQAFLDASTEKKKTTSPLGARNPKEKPLPDKGGLDSEPGPKPPDSAQHQE